VIELVGVAMPKVDPLETEDRDRAADDMVEAWRLLGVPRDGSRRVRPIPDPLAVSSCCRPAGRAKPSRDRSAPGVEGARVDCRRAQRASARCPAPDALINSDRTIAFSRDGVKNKMRTSMPTDGPPAVSGAEGAAGSLGNG